MRVCACVLCACMHEYVCFCVGALMLSFAFLVITFFNDLIVITGLSDPE